MKRIIKFIYSCVPFKDFFFKGLKKVWQPPESVYKHLHFHGVFRVNVNEKKGFKIMHYGFEIENEIFWNGLGKSWESVSLNLWKELCLNSTVIFDIGANTGVYSLVAKSLNPSAKVFAFEPVERVFKKLLYNIQINKYNIICFQKAVSNSIGKAIIYDTDDPHIYSVTVNKNFQPYSKKVYEVEIETVTLEKVIKQENLKNVDLVKIDVETHEPEVLEGFGEYLARFKPNMLIEILNDEVGAKIRNIVDGLDYLYFNIDENKGIRQVQKIEHSDYYNYLLCNKVTALQLKLISE